MKLGWILAAVFALAMILGAGPGVLLVNQPATWFGLPRLYVWGMFWCAVEIAVVVAAYLLVWTTNDEAAN
jgi:hypothetical protein